MGNFRSDDRRSGYGRSRSGGRSGGFNRERGFGGRREGGFGRGRGSERNFIKTEVTCDKCGKQTTVPFKPTGDKPVLCRECFSGGKGSDRSFSSGAGAGPSQGMSQEQFKLINTKLDKILGILEQIEFEELDEEESEDEEENEESNEKEQ